MKDVPKTVTLSPANAWTGGDSLEITWNGITTLSGSIKEIQYFRYYGSDRWDWTAIPGTAGKASGSATIDTSLWENMNYGIDVRAIDKDGKEGSRTTSTDRYMKDDVPKAVTLSPANTWTDSDSLKITWSSITTLSGSIKEIQYFRYSGSEKWEWTAIPNTAKKASGSAIIDTSLWENKNYGIDVRAIDKYGNVGSRTTSTDRYMKNVSMTGSEEGSTLVSVSSKDVVIVDASNNPVSESYIVPSAPDTTGNMILYSLPEGEYL